MDWHNGLCLCKFSGGLLYIWQILFHSRWRTNVQVNTNLHLHPHEYVVQLLHGKRMNEYVLRKMMLTFQWRQVNEWICWKTYYLSEMFHLLCAPFVGYTHLLSLMDLCKMGEFVCFYCLHFDWNYNFLFIH